MKSKKRNPCPICECDRTHALSDESAVEIYEFLEAISANFQSRYWPRIERYYAMMANRNINEQTPWRRKDNPF
jgi:hypothetical protein